MAHVKQLAIGLNSRVGCAIARYKKKEWMFQLTVCLYGCRKRINKPPYQPGKYAGEYCVCGVGSEFKYLCHPNERVKNCIDAEDNDKATKEESDENYDYEEDNDKKPKKPKKEWKSLTGKILEVIDCLRGLCNTIL